MIANAIPPHGWDGTSLPLSNLSSFTTEDIEEVHSHMSRILCPHKLRAEGNPPIAFRHYQASLNSVTFNATEYGNSYGRIMVDVPPMDAMYLVQFSLSGLAEFTQNGSTFSLRPGELWVFGPDARANETMSEGYRHISVKIAKDRLNSVLARELGFFPGDVRFLDQPVRVEGAVAAFANLVRMICDDFNLGLGGITHNRTSGVAEEILLRLLLAAVPHNHSELYNGPSVCPAPYYVRRVEEYIREHARDTIMMAELTAVSGVSARSLHAGFRRFRNMSPMTYLRNHRLNLANRELKKAVDCGLSVTDVAFSCGFTHLSKFARYYLERFGERPSATLRRNS